MEQQATNNTAFSLEHASQNKMDICRACPVNVRMNILLWRLVEGSLGMRPGDSISVRFYCDGCPHVHPKRAPRTHAQPNSNCALGL